MKHIALAGILLTALLALTLGGCSKEKKKPSAAEMMAVQMHAQKQWRRARTTEAIDQMDKIYKAAAVYYQTPKIDRNGVKLPCQVPRSQGVTPVEGTCCLSLGGPDHDDDGRCDMTDDYWDEETWSALNFQLNDQHYFVYSFYSNGLTGADTIFTIQANADLDCDGIQSTFQRLGFGDPNATMAECALQGSAAFYIENETE